MDKELILLGPWCLADEKNRLLLNGRSYLIAPSPWKPAIKLKDAQDTCYGIYEETLHELSTKLNLLHSVSYDEKYWRVLVGPWLAYFIEILYERYARIENAVACFPDIYTYVLPESSCKLRVIDTYDFVSIKGKASEDRYNLKLFSIIMRYLYPERCLERDYIKQQHEKRVATRDNFAKRLFYGMKGLKDAFYRPDVILSDMHKMSCAQSLSIELQCRPSSVCFKHFKRKHVLESYYDYSETQRSRLKFNETADKFQALLLRLIPRAIPMCFIENLKKYNRGVKSKGLKAVGSATGWYFNENFKFFAAESSLTGARLMDFQPGGGYGMLLSVPSEISSLERDVFYTWGWRSENSEKTTPLASPYLSKLKETHKRSEERILFVGTTSHKYLCRFASFITPDDIPQYFVDKKRFVDGLNKSVRQKLVYRPYYEVGWGEINTIKNLMPEISILSKGRLVNLMQKSKVAVFDYFGTSTMEALIIDVPVVWFYNPAANLIRSESVRYFEMLKEAGIMHNSPEEAAKKVNEIYGDPLQWWQYPKVQKAKNAFCDRFAATSSNWRKEWIDALNV